MTMSQRLRIGFVGPRNLESLQDRKAQGGTAASIAATLTRHCGEVVNIGKTAPVPPPGWLRALERVERRLLHLSRYRWTFSRKCAKQLSVLIEKNLYKTPGVDVIIGVRDEGRGLAFLDTGLPIIYCSDGPVLATRRMAYRWYPTHGNLLQRTLRQILDIQQRVFDRATALVMASHWAREAIVGDHGIAAEKIWVIPDGPNLTDDEIPSREVALAAHHRDTCRLLFIARKNRWLAKGGDIALAAVKKLNAMGIAAELIAVGCLPPDSVGEDHIRKVSYLDKNDAEDRERLLALFLESHFLLVPTRAEKYGKVFCEANAFGLPAIGAAVGGVTEIIRDGENGYALPLEACGEQYAKLIAEVYADPKRYAALVRSSRQAYEDRLNWDVWGRGMQECLKTVLPPELAEKVGPGTSVQGGAR